MLTNDPLSQWDQDHFFHASTHLAQFARGEIPSRIMTGGEGVYVTDRDDNRFLDAFAGLYCVNVGYGRQSISEAIAGRVIKSSALPLIEWVIFIVSYYQDKDRVHQDESKWHWQTAFYYGNLCCEP